jgi:putative PIG3 family NAD(P)H quinone oxidoreductase
MHAIVVEDDSLAWRPVPRPEPGPGQVRIAVAATAVNRADLAQRAGRYPPPPGASEILGLECAGTVEAVGEGVTEVAEGDRVAALLTGGGYAEAVVCPATHLLPVPPDMPWSVAAALPEALCTAFVNLVMEARLQPGERVLLHAGASGLGTIALQLLRAWGHRSWITAGTDQKIARCRDLGADGGTNRHTGDFVEDVRTWTDGGGVDVILDPVGGDYIARDQRCLAHRGRIVLIGLLGGREAQVDLGRLMVKRQRLLGSVLRARSDEEKAGILSRVHAEAWPLCTDGTITPILDRILPIQEAGHAHARIASNQTIGKVVLTV